MTASSQVPPVQRLRGWRASATLRRGLTDCSLVVPTYERPGAITTLLDALLLLADTPADVVIVDGSRGRSTEGALKTWIGANTPRFDLSYVRSPAGLTLQRNVGVDASTGAFVFFLDDDCVPYAGYFQAIRDVFARDTIATVGAVAGAIVNNMGGRLSWRWRVRFALGLAKRADPGSYLDSGVSLPITHVPRFTGTRRVAVVPGGAVGYRRAALDVQRFSLYFSGYAQGEDLEMSLRLGREWTLLWCGDAHVSHNHAPQGRPNAAKKGYMEVRNRYFIWKRHATPGFAGSVRFWLDFVYGMGVDVLEFFAHPRSLAPLHHVRGVMRGLLSCLTDRPRYDEPPVRREYEIALEEVDCSPRAPLAFGTGGLQVSRGRGYGDDSSVTRPDDGRAVPNVVIFWDYDTQWGADRSRNPLGTPNWGALEFPNTDALLELHAKYDIPACFAVVGSAALPGTRPYHDPDQIRRIHDAGNEVASHSFRHEWLPALDSAALDETLRCSKDALEQCIGAEVVSFVPPFNQPFDYLEKLSVSLSERWSVRHARTDVGRLCASLGNAGYKFCRLAYRPLYERVVQVVRRRSLRQPGYLEDISGVACLRLNLPVGFTPEVQQILERHLDRGGLWTLNGHPHSVSDDANPQSIRLLEPLLALIRQWREQGRIRTVLPRDLVGQEALQWSS